MVRWSAMALAGAMIAWFALPVAAQSSPAPTAQSEGLPAGISRLDNGSFVYRPAVAANAVPGVMVLFHGAGGDARRFLDLFRDEADRRNLILLSVQSLGSTWDVVGSRGREAWSVGRARSAPAAGRDAKRVSAAVLTLLRRTAVQSDRIIAAGFSDGASYALTIGLAKDQPFRSVIALAPGFARDSRPGRPVRIAIAHGTQDRVLPFAGAKQIATELQGRGHPVLFLPFDGGHGIEEESLAQALDFALQDRR